MVFKYIFFAVWKLRKNVNENLISTHGKVFIYYWFYQKKNSWNLFFRKHAEKIENIWILEPKKVLKNTQKRNTSKSQNPKNQESKIFEQLFFKI